MHWWKILPNQIRLSKFSVSAPKIFFNFFQEMKKIIISVVAGSTLSDNPSSFDWWTSGSENSTSISHCCQSKYVFQVLVRGLKRNTTLHSLFHFLSVTVILCHALLLVTVSLISSLHDCATSACVFKIIAISFSFAGHFRLIGINLTIKGLWTSETRWAYFEMCSFWDCFSLEGYRWQSKTYNRIRFQGHICNFFSSEREELLNR